MRGTKGGAADDDYEVGADVEEGRANGADKPLSSRYRGVCWNRKNRRWQAAINSGGKYVYLGSFLSEYDAARAFDKAAVKLRGTRAKLNFQYSEYVDEHGNLLEDPKMKNVMHKIEVIQGGTGGTGSGGAAGGHLYHHHHHHLQHGGTAAALRAGDAAGTATISDEGGFQHHHQLHQLLLQGGPGGEGAQAAMALPLPAALPQDGGLLGPQVKQPQQPQQQIHACSSGGSEGTRPGSEWPAGPRGGGLSPPPPSQQPTLSLNLAAPAGGMQQQQQQLTQHQHQHQHQQPVFQQYAEAVTAGAPQGSALPAPPLPLPPPGTAAPVPVAVAVPPLRMVHPPAPRGGRGGPHGAQPPSPLHHMYGSSAAAAAPTPCISGGGGGGGGGGEGGCFDILPPGRASAAGYAGGATPPPPPPVARSPTSSAVAHRAIQGELPPGSSVLCLLPNRFQNNPEDMCGVLFLDPGSPGLFGSAVWTGKNIIRMGQYDTERDARQASIRCMQLFRVFYLDMPRTELFNALTAILGCGGGGPPGGTTAPDDAQHQQQFDGVLAPLQQPYGPRGGGAAAGARGSAGGCLGLCELPVEQSAAAHPHHHPHHHFPHHQHHQQQQQHVAHPHAQSGMYGQRGSGGDAGMSYHGPSGDDGLQQQQQHHHQHHSQQQQADCGGSAGAVGGSIAMPGMGYGPAHEPVPVAPQSLSRQAAKQQPQQELDHLFTYMAMISRAGKASSAAGAASCASGDAGGGGRDAECGLLPLQNGTGGGGEGGGIAGSGVLGKRQLPEGGYVTLHGGPCHHQQQQGEMKRLRLDSSRGPELEFVLKPPSGEVRAAHKLQLPVMVKQLQQASAGGL